MAACRCVPIAIYLSFRDRLEARPALGFAGRGLEGRLRDSFPVDF